MGPRYPGAESNYAAEPTLVSPDGMIREGWGQNSGAETGGAETGGAKPSG